LCVRVKEDLAVPEPRLRPIQLAAIVALSVLVLGPGLGSSGRLTYHEAIWAQVAREMLATGSVVVPTLDGRPWLEKPPLGPWLIALAGSMAGGVSEAAARAPAALAATLLALGVAALAARRFGPTVGLLAGCIQVTTAWTVMRGRLAESDMILAALVTATLMVFDRLRDEATDPSPGSRPWRWMFFALLGVTSLAKGIGFGAVLVGAAVVLVLVWDRDAPSIRALAFPKGWMLAAALTFAWPLLVLMRHPAALGIWALHVGDRLASRPEYFVGESWWQYAPALLWQVLPWTPLALVGAWSSLRRAVVHQSPSDRLLWAWAVGPAVLVSLATVKNGHYLIYALPPWSIWSALGLVRLGDRFRSRGWTPGWIRRGAVAGFAALGLIYAVGFAVFGPWFDRRGAEWAFYERAGRILRPEEPLALLYDDWDRKPYPNPFGPVPHDLAVRLYYLNRPACWRPSPSALAEQPPAPPPAAFAVIGRDRDVPALRRLGEIEPLARGPTARSDRAFALYRITPGNDRIAKDIRN
jgi:4-amino-4-deoxy-L-arabinose transferase-like glycosyltransferase